MPGAIREFQFLEYTDSHGLIKHEVDSSGRRGRGVVDVARVGGYGGVVAPHPTLSPTGEGVRGCARLTMRFVGGAGRCCAAEIAEAAPHRAQVRVFRLAGLTSP